MKRPWKHLGLSLLLFSPGLLRGQYQIDWSRIGGGGGQATGGVYAVSSTTGQSGSGVAAGGPFALVSGYWALLGSLPTAGAPRLAIERFGDQVLVSWPTWAGDFILQETDSLDNYPAIEWKDVPPPYTTNGGRIFVAFPVRNSGLRLATDEEVIRIPAKRVVKLRSR